MGEQLGREAFAERIGGTFEIPTGEGQTVALRAEDIQDYAEADGTRFSVRFRGPREVFLPQGTYQVTPEGDRPFDLFLVPIAQDAEGFRYEAAFNREGA